MLFDGIIKQRLTELGKESLHHETHRCMYGALDVKPGRHIDVTPRYIIVNSRIEVNHVLDFYSSKFAVSKFYNGSFNIPVPLRYFCILRYTRMKELTVIQVCVGSWKIVST